MIAFGDQAMHWASGGGVAYAIKGSVIGRAESAGSQYSMVKEDGMFCLQTNEVHGVVAYDARGNKDGTLTNTLAGDHQNRVTDYTALAVQASWWDEEQVAGTLTKNGAGGQQRMPEKGNFGAVLQADVAFSRGGYGDWSPNESITSLCARDAKDQSSIVVPSNKEWPKQIADTLTVAYAKKWGLEDQHINGGAGLFHRTLSGRPRRLTPLECERLMGWGDAWTAVGINEQGTEYALSDTARYKLCGNGVGSPVAQWIATQLLTLEAQ